MRRAYEFDSFGEITIKGYHWETEATHKGVVVLAHGMAETVERYDELAAYLNKNGYVVFGNAHRGHGQTAGDPSRLGIIGDDGWTKMKSDLKQSVILAKTTYPNLPVFMLGHSMGSFLLRDFILTDSKMLQGAIISGTGFKPLNQIKQAKRLANIVRKLKGKHHPSRLLHTLTFGRNNRRIHNPKTALDWLSRDDNEVQAYLEDPYCGQIHSSGFYYEFAHNLIRILYQGSFQNKNKHMPMLIISGKEDPVGDYGLGPVRTRSYYRSRGFSTELVLYPEARHELFHEVNREEVFQDITDWLNQSVITL